MGCVFAMTVKVLGAGSLGEDSIGILGEPFSKVGQGAGERAGQGTAEEMDELELLEFLAADLDPVPADPTFRRQLADLLWDMVRDGRGLRNRDH